MTLDDRDMVFLRTYIDGPRIWDAADLFRDVVRLAGMGMLQPFDEEAFTLTDAGRAEIAKDVELRQHCVEKHDLRRTSGLIGERLVNWHEFDHQVVAGHSHDEEDSRE